jgi:cytochrome c oxidase accessory protein FixG
MNLVSEEKSMREDFRNHLATADKHGRRRWLFPKRVDGKWYRLRSRLSWILVGLMFAGPFVQIDGNPLLMFNIVERRFSILGRIFWPQDAAIFAIAMLIFFTGIVVFTAAFGRLWCGWTCPQTVLMEMVFRKIEYAIEGDSDAQKKLHTAPWSREKFAKKLTKHSIFFALSFLISNCLLSYIIGLQSLVEIITDDPRSHIAGLSFMMAFTIMFYLLFARFREQACTYICPYGRLQSAMLDEDSMIVAYDYKRGEGRGRFQRAQTHQNRQAEGFGDCVNCRQCVSVCPTGIDIRNGLQMECVNCTACIDACDAVMDKLGWQRGLIHYASLNSIEKSQPFRFNGRMAWYAAVLVALIGVFLTLLFTRNAVDCTLLRAPGGLYQQTAEGRVSNLYTLKAVNKSKRDLPLEFRMENYSGEIRVMSGAFVAPKENLSQTSLLIALDQSSLRNGKAQILIGVYAEGKKIDTLKTTLIGPRD